MLKKLLTNKGPHFEFICATTPGLEPPLEEYGYRPDELINVIKRSQILPCPGFPSIATT